MKNLTLKELLTTLRDPTGARLSDEKRITHITHLDGDMTLCGLAARNIWLVEMEMDGNITSHALAKVTCDGCRRIEKVTR